MLGHPEMTSLPRRIKSLRRSKSALTTWQSFSCCPSASWRRGLLIQAMVSKKSWKWWIIFDDIPQLMAMMWGNADKPWELRVSYVQIYPSLGSKSINRSMVIVSQPERAFGGVDLASWRQEGALPLELCMPFTCQITGLCSVFILGGNL